MKRRKFAMPGKAAHVLMLLLSFLMALCVFAAVIFTSVSYVLNTPKLHQKIALSDAVQAEQMKEITEDVTQLAGKYGFSADTILNAISQEDIRQFNLDVIAWWMQLPVSGTSLLAPEWPTDGYSELLMTDEGFTAKQKNAQSAADNKAVPVLADAIREDILPIRSELISLAMSKVLGKADVSVYMAYVPYLSWIFAALALLCFAVMMLLSYKRPVRGIAFTGAAFAAAGLLLLFLILFAWILKIPGSVSEMSVLLGMQISMLMKWLAKAYGIAAAGLIAVGYALIILHQKAMHTLRKQSV